MIVCPYCAFRNEDGTLFCEQCKSDLMAGADRPSETHQPPNVETGKHVPIGDAIPFAEPMAEGALPASMAIAQPKDALAEAPTVPPEDLPAEPAPAAAAPPEPAVPLPDGAQPKLVVLRGVRINAEYPLYDGENFIGRTDEKPVDIDLEDQEPPDRIWSSRQHACITVKDSVLVIEDLNSANGTFVNRTRVYSNEKRTLNAGDVIQIGTVQLKVKL